MTSDYNQSALARLAAALLRDRQPVSSDEARLQLLSALGAYAPESAVIDRTVRDHFGAR